MLMKDDPKKSVSVIMGKLMGKEQEPKEAPTQDGVEQDDSVAVETAAEELMNAVEMKSPKAIVEAFKSLMQLCQTEQE